jgi:hypothetical protein
MRAESTVSEAVARSPRRCALPCVTRYAGELGVWVAAVQPLPQVVSKVVRLVRMTGEHRNHFLALGNSLCHVPASAALSLI